ncbi:hypothetical protein CIW54_22505 [Paraburkholderia sp. T12-10]|nr:hypothetical protein CIW54_22505 [Paraburkholderia sp. T12-10]
MKQAQTRERARFSIGDRVVYLKFFEYPGRGFEPHERQQIEALSIGERVTIRDHVIERVEDKKDDTAEAWGLLAGLMVFLGLAFWLFRTAWHAISAHGWMYAASAKLSALLNGIVMRPPGDALGAAVKVIESPSPGLILLSLFLILVISLAISAATAFATRCFVAQAVEEMINGESTSSRYAALLDVLVPTVAVIVFMLCRSSGFGLQASLFDGATVIGIGLLVSHRLTRPKRPRS